MTDQEIATLAAETWPGAGTIDIVMIVERLRGHADAVILEAMKQCRAGQGADAFRCDPVRLGKLAALIDRRSRGETVEAWERTREEFRESQALCARIEAENAQLREQVATLPPEIEQQAIAELSEELDGLARLIGSRGRGLKLVQARMIQIARRSNDSDEITEARGAPGSPPVEAGAAVPCAGEGGGKHARASAADGGVGKGDSGDRVADPVDPLARGGRA